MNGCQSIAFWKPSRSQSHDRITLPFITYYLPIEYVLLCQVIYNTFLSALVERLL